MEKTEEIVKEVLEKNINSRFSDYILYLEVINNLKPELKNYDFKEIFINHKNYGLPSFKCVERARRKLEQKGLYISPKNIKIEREKMIKKYLDYAINEGGI